jgi:cell shape-determining protein MreD
MIYPLYFLILYLALPLNSLVDLITILIFFVAFNEHDKFSIIFAFFCGLLVDLYNPLKFGLNTIVLTVLSQILIYVRKYVAKGLSPVFFTFLIFYLLRVFIITLAAPGAFRIVNVLITIVLFLPLSALMNKFLRRSWMKT